MKKDNNDKKNDKKQDKYMALGMCFGLLAGSAVMSILTMFGQIAWGGFSGWNRLLVGMVIGLVISKK